MDDPTCSMYVTVEVLTKIMLKKAGWACFPILCNLHSFQLVQLKSRLQLTVFCTSLEQAEAKDTLH